MMNFAASDGGGDRRLEIGVGRNGAVEDEGETTEERGQKAVQRAASRRSLGLAPAAAGKPRLLARGLYFFGALTHLCSASRA